MVKIADMLTSIRNGIRNGDMDPKKQVRVLSSITIEKIVQILIREGFIKNMRKHRENNKNFLVLTLRPRLRRMRRSRQFLSFKCISRPGARIYSNCKKMPRILGGMGIVILSTSRGIMTDREARLEGIGGEVLCYIW
uniref:Small ribosomal subunit protein uS8c n=1 Tax=Circaeaster agrestis TaxID=39288 RepID=A0A6M8PQA0_9MAGN|nr:ribosomal protein S8 [Circaeaster agrestis]QKI33401.1 ribosomal protein S8 [Circaeaster agrestis]QKI33826.1 ribosomal protein S8 [Circaeaster agrestis]